MTATTAALSLLALVVFGGEAIQGFAKVMLCGVIVSTYSAIFISSPSLIYLGVHGKADTEFAAAEDKAKPGKPASPTARYGKAQSSQVP